MVVQKPCRLVVEERHLREIDDGAPIGLSHRTPNDCHGHPSALALEFAAWPQHDRPTISPRPGDNRRIAVLHI
jgi:hypothetical protein